MTSSGFDTDNNMVAQVYSLPGLIRDELQSLDMRVRRVLDHNEILSVKRVVIEGCGDSHMAGLATELAFEQLAGIPTEPFTAMQAARYAAPYIAKNIPRNPLALAISVSGNVVRTREALQLLQSEGALGVAITANPESPLGKAANIVLDCAVPDFAPAPGVRSYRVSLMVLYLLAIHLAEVRGKMTQDQANATRQQLLATADAIEKTIDAIDGKSRQLAEEFAEQNSYVFVSDGPNYATALFSAAKVIEAAGRHAMGQDTEEWAHLQYFASVETSTPTFVIAPGFRGHSRAAEVVKQMERVGRITVAVVPEGDDRVAPAAKHVLPVVGDVPEIFTPMVYAVAGELFSAHLSDVVGEPFFRRNNAAYDPGNDIYDNVVLTEIVQ